MRLLIFTDPHRGFNDKTKKIHDQVFSKIDPNSFDAVIVSGDWGTNRLKHVKESFRAFRQAFPDKPILGVLGNHDLWETNHRISSLTSKYNLIYSHAKRFNIHLLENNPFEMNGVLFLGFDGWYNHSPHDTTNDFEHISHFHQGSSAHEFLKRKADVAATNLQDVEKKGKKVVTVTHFPCIKEFMDSEEWCGNPDNGKIILGFSDLIIFGHTHVAMDKKIGKCRIINVGIDHEVNPSLPKDERYNKLAYKIVEI